MHHEIRIMIYHSFRTASAESLVIPFESVIIVRDGTLIELFAFMNLARMHRQT